ncbi:MAG: response regulator [Nitrospina sp.]|nr:response regulator [Nitrospina sp.]
MTKKILVADNSITIQKIVAMAFENEDAVVEGASRAQEALDRMDFFKPDIVLADIDMKDLTGFDLSQKIKADSKFNTVKVLLLASDLEDFNKNLFDSSGADDRISKPFKSEDIIKKVNDLLSEKLPDPIDETTIKLSTKNIIKEENSTINLSSADLVKPIDSSPKEKIGLKAKKTKTVEEGTLDEMIEDVESLKKAVTPPDACYDKLSDEVSPTHEDAVGDELDTAFREIVNFGSRKEPDKIKVLQHEPIDGPSPLESVSPEPEDLLGEITSSVVEGRKNMATTSLLGKNPSRTSKLSHEVKGQQAATTVQKNQTLEDIIHASIKKELAEVSNSITQSIREVVQEITPKIVREIVKEEVDKIKNS